MNEKTYTNDYTIEAVEKALKILSQFTESEPSHTFTQLQQRAGVTKGTLVRYLFTLQKHNYISFEEKSNTYRLGNAVLELGIAFRNATNIVKVAESYMQQLSNEYGLICYLGKKNKDRLLVLEKTFPSKMPGWAAFMATEGSDLPLYSTGIGRLFLSEMTDDEVMRYLDSINLVAYTEMTIVDKNELLEIVRKARRDGISYNKGENERFIQSICAPIYNRSGNIIAGISACGFSEMLDQIGRGVIETRIREIGYQISRELGYTPNTL